MKNVSRWFTLVSAVAVGIVAAGCGSESMSGPSEVVTGARTEEQGAQAFAKATTDAAIETELVGFVKSVSAPSLTVAGRTVVTSQATEITRNKVKVPFGSIKVGEHVKVQGVVRADGKLQAREIKVAYKGSTPNTLPGDRPSDDGPNHDAGDDHDGNGNDDGPNHDAGDDHGGNGNDDDPNDDAGDDNGNHGGGHN